MDKKDTFEGTSKLAFPTIPHELLDIICTGKEATDEQKNEITRITRELGKNICL